MADAAPWALITSSVFVRFRERVPCENPDDSNRPMPQQDYRPQSGVKQGAIVA